MEITHGTGSAAVPSWCAWTVCTDVRGAKIVQLLKWTRRFRRVPDIDFDAATHCA
jgi:hypothetical protein